MSSRVFITGAGIVSAMGVGMEVNLNALQNGVTGIGPIKHLNTIHQNDIPAGEVKLSDAELKALCGLPATITNLTRTTLLGLLAAQQAFPEKIRQGGYLRTGLISATSVGGMGETENFYPDFMQDREQGGNISRVATHDCGDSTERIAHLLGITDYVSTISTACSSSANSIMLGARMVGRGLLDRVLVGGTDALTKFTLNGFNSLQILDHQWCQPFDENRRGLNLGEGAAYLLLESEAVAMRHPERILGLISGYGNANDAFHQTASSPEGKGATLAMQKALKVSGLRPGDIDYVNAHGTGTENNDLTEGLALQQIFGNSIPPFSSTKAYTGHTLAAAGAIEAVISLLAIQNGALFPNLNHKQRMKEFDLLPVLQTGEANIGNVLSNSFGFGGNSSCLIISKYHG